VQGITMKPLVRVLNIALATTVGEGEFALLHEFHRGVVSNTMAGMEEVIGTHGSYRMMVRAFTSTSLAFLQVLSKWFSQTFIRPVFQKHSEIKGKSLIAKHEELEFHKFGEKLGKIEEQINMISSNNACNNNNTSTMGLRKVSSQKLCVLDEQFAAIDRSYLPSAYGTTMLDAQDNREHDFFANYLSKFGFFCKVTL
jgi:hypothetical protein